MPAKKRSRSTAAARTRRKSATLKKKTARATVGKQTKKRTTKKRAGSTTRSKVRKAAARSAKKTKAGKKTSRSTTKVSARSRAKATRTEKSRKTARSAKPKATTRGSSTARSTRPRTGSGLSARDLEQFRTMLLIKRAQLAGDVSTLHDISRQRGSGDLSHMPIHMADIGSDNFEHEFTLGLIQSERALLGEINEALKRIEEGTYGICAATGKPIGKARLKAKPWAKYCYEYELELERGRARRF